MFIAAHGDSDIHFGDGGASEGSGSVNDAAQ